MIEEKEKVHLSWFTKKTGFGLEVLYAGMFFIFLAATIASGKVPLC
jgi:hypothetical protein